jgi:hypothetical protein
VKAKTPWTSAAARRMIAFAGGDSTVEEAVVRVVTDLRRGVRSPPTNLDEIARKLRVDDCKAESLPVAGELRRVGDRLTIRYATGLPVGRRRFTIAHELGHAFFERTGPNCPRRGEELERICDLFAVELLMPVAQIQDVLAACTPNALFEAASHFDVSITAAMFRLAELTRMDAALDDGQRRTGTMRALTEPDPHLDELVAECRRSGEAEAVIRLMPNSAWNGDWSVRASTDNGGHLVLMTAEPLDIKTVATAAGSTSTNRAQQLDAVREIQALLRRLDPAGGIHG